MTTTSKTSRPARITGEAGVAITLHKLQRVAFKKGDAPFIRAVKERAVKAWFEMVQLDQQCAMWALALSLPKGYSIVPFDYGHVSSRRTAVQFSNWKYADHREGYTQYEFYEDMRDIRSSISWDVKLWQQEIAPAIVAAGMVPKGWSNVFLPAAQQALTANEIREALRTVKSKNVRSDDNGDDDGGPVDGHN
jgi:uncharacterized protein YbdZ (MbtH family)